VREKERLRESVGKSEWSLATILAEGSAEKREVAHIRKGVIEKNTTWNGIQEEDAIGDDESDACL
jgi:hypothetical protein